MIGKHPKTGLVKKYEIGTFYSSHSCYNITYDKKQTAARFRALRILANVGIESHCLRLSNWMKE